MSATSDVPRFAQLTYTTFDRGTDAGGGWQVKDVTGQLTSAEQEALRSRISTQFASSVTVPAFPTPEEIRALPRRLLYAPADQGATGYWHTAPAGADATGRPGNVFAHVVLDRRPAEREPALRPTDLWRSAHWLLPFGPRQVLGSTLDGVPDPPWGEVDLDRSRVLTFLLDPTQWRVGVLQGLLDAVDAAMRGGPRVVLGTETPESAAWWIAAVSHLMSAGTARRLFWSTQETAASLPSAWSKGVHLAVVPSGDLSAVADGDIVVIAEDERIKAGDLSGEPHRTRAGSCVTVTPWSVIAQVVLQNAALAEKALALQDSIAATVGDRDLPPAWPMAMVVAHLPEELAEAHHEASLLVATASPPALHEVPELLAARARLLSGSIGATTADAFAEAALPGSDSSARSEVARNVYLGRALNDEEWLTRPEGVPLPPADPRPRPRDRALVEQVRTALIGAGRRAAAQGPDADPVPMAAMALRLIDLIVRADLLDAEDDDQQATIDVAHRLVNRVVDPLLVDPDLGPRMVQVVGPVGEPTQRSYVRPCVARHLDERTGVPGRRIPPAVLRWLYPTPPTPPSPGELASPGAVPDPALLELAAQVTQVVPDPSAFRLLALWGILTELPSDERMAPELERLMTGGAWSPPELIAVIGHFGLPAIARFLLPTLAAGPSGPHLQALVDAVLDPAHRPRPRHDRDPAVDAVTRVAELRDLADAWWRGPEREMWSKHVRRLIGCAPGVLDVLGVEELAEDVLPSLVAACSVDIMCWPTDTAAPELMTKLLVHPVVMSRSAAAAEIIGTAVNNGVVSDVDVVYAALCGSPSAPTGDLCPSPIRGLGLVTVGAGGAAEPLLDHVIRLRLHYRGLRNAAEVNDVVLRMISGELHRTADRREADRRIVEYEAFVRHWWSNLGVTGEVVAGPSRSLFRGRS